jgi:pimeloyl-ACP methyl ester carboxylesterase
MGFGSYSPQSQLMHCSKQSCVYLAREFLSQQVRSRKSYIVLVAALATLLGCAPLAKVREVKPRLGAQHGTLPRLLAEQQIANGQEVERTDPGRAIGSYLAGVQSATSQLRRNPRDRLALRDYDFALSRVFSVIRDAHLDPWTHPLRVPAANGSDYVLTQRHPKNRLWKAQDYELIPADELDLRGRLVAQRVTREGIGAPLVAIRNPQAPTIRQPFVPPKVYTAATAVAEFGGRQCQIEFVDPLDTETVRVFGKSLPCAADFTAPIAVGLSREHPEKVGVPALLDPDKFAAKARLIQVQPYDPKKIPVLFVHGLQSTPVSWVPMVNAIWSDPGLRRNYQVWVFNYPTGYPVPYSALLLRRQLHALDKTFPNHRPIVLVGHSMGGILCRLMITDSRGDKIWRYFFGKSPAQTNLSTESKALIREALIFKPQRDVARVIFISTPHRGSVIAQGPIGRIASSLIHKPLEFVRLSPEIMQASVVQEEDPGVLKLRRIPDSIDTLSPNDAWVKSTSTLPTEKGIPYHSIIGDRGRGDTPNSSDGVVPYWSSHLEGARSEKIVPSGHGANQNPEATAEVIRILKRHIDRDTRGEY